ncbi:Glutathione S-transferase omega-1 [Smittium mucronatum]|uniref:Glutathione S-transferase omega-1 n=1 Tax=Smittium mucronatum TaxID=133383 RepID=A0A1R0GUI7_9FUNG|nr:Glutathione S-transferase omega-1 [Smittium mucronatum]
MYPYSETKISLYNSKICPYAQRVAIALEEAKISHENFEIDLSNKPEWFEEVNPASKVPTMRLPTGEIIVESFLMIEYIAEQYPESKLMPESPLDKYKVRFFVEYFGTKVIPLMFKLIHAYKDETVKAEAYSEIVEELRVVNKKLLENSDTGPFFFGKDFTIADIATITFVERLEMALEITNLEIKSVSGLERYNVWKSTIMAKPSYISSLATREELMESYKKFMK